MKKRIEHSIVARRSGLLKKRKTSRVDTAVAIGSKVAVRSQDVNLADVIAAEKRQFKEEYRGIGKNSDVRALKKEQNKGSKSPKEVMGFRGVDSPYGVNGVFISDTQSSPKAIVNDRLAKGERETFVRIGLEEKIKVAKEKWDAGFRITEQDMRLLTEGNDPLFSKDELPGVRKANKKRPKTGISAVTYKSGEVKPTDSMLMVEMGTTRTQKVSTHARDAMPKSLSGILGAILSIGVSADVRLAIDLRVSKYFDGKMSEVEMHKYLVHLKKAVAVNKAEELRKEKARMAASEAAL